VDNTLRLWLVNEDGLCAPRRDTTFPVLVRTIFTQWRAFGDRIRWTGCALWQVSNGATGALSETTRRLVTGLDFSNDGKYLASCSDDFTVRVWRVSDSS